ncbi:MAG: PIN domain-containing protein [Burkholderiales bacterium]|nr:PIN domain-containing protein [Burkholderiales bacterium]
MSAPVFVDTKVLVYARDLREKAKQPAAALWIEQLWRERSGRTSTQVLSEFYVTVTRKLKPGMSAAQAWDEVNAFLSWHPQAVDAALLERAYQIEQRYHLSWWDSAVVGAAQLQDCALLLTEDLQDGAVFGSVTVRSPFTLAAEDPRAIYRLPPPESAHRARGRPARKPR